MGRKNRGDATGRPVGWSAVERWWGRPNWRGSEALLSGYLPGMNDEGSGLLFPKKALGFSVSFKWVKVQPSGVW